MLLILVKCFNLVKCDWIILFFLNLFWFEKEIIVFRIIIKCRSCVYRFYLFKVLGGGRVGV